jgi:hypothetical protein
MTSRFFLLAGVLLAGSSARGARGDPVLLLDVSSPSVDEGVRRTAMQALGPALARELGWKVTAAPDPDEALRQKLAPLLARAKAHSEAFRERRALAVLEEAEKVFRAAVGPVTGIEPLCDLLLRQARLLADLGDRDELRAVLERLEALQPGRPLAAASFPPAVLRLARSLQQKLGKGELRIAALPVGQSVWVDGALRGAPPVRLTLPAGEHFVVVGNAAERVGRAVQVSAGQVFSLKQQLSQPDVARREAGRRAGATWVAALELAPAAAGQQGMLHVVRVDAPGSARQLRATAAGADAVVAALARRLRLALTPRRAASRPVAQLPRSALPSPPAGAPARQPRRWWTAWWLWTGVAVVVGGAAAGTAVALTRDRSARIHLLVDH